MFKTLLTSELDTGASHVDIKTRSNETAQERGKVTPV